MHLDMGTVDVQGENSKHHSTMPYSSNDADVLFDKLETEIIIGVHLKLFTSVGSHTCSEATMGGPQDFPKSLCTQRWPA